MLPSHWHVGTQNGQCQYIESWVLFPLRHPRPKRRLIVQNGGPGVSKVLPEDGLFAYKACEAWHILNHRFKLLNGCSKIHRHLRLAFLRGKSTLHIFRSIWWRRLRSYPHRTVLFEQKTFLWSRWIIGLRSYYFSWGQDPLQNVERQMQRYSESEAYCQENQNWEPRHNLLQKRSYSFISIRRCYECGAWKYRNGTVQVNFKFQGNRDWI